MTRVTTVPIIRCDSALPPQLVTCERIVEAGTREATRWRIDHGADICPACWDAMQAIEDWRTNR